MLSQNQHKSFVNSFHWRSKNHNFTHLVLEQIYLHIYSKKPADFSTPHSLNFQTVSLNTTTCMRIQFHIKEKYMMTFVYIFLFFTLLHLQKISNVRVKLGFCT